MAENDQWCKITVFCSKILGDSNRRNQYMHMWLTRARPAGGLASQPAGQIAPGVQCYHCVPREIRCKEELEVWEVLGEVWEGCRRGLGGFQSGNERLRKVPKGSKGVPKPFRTVFCSVISTSESGGSSPKAFLRPSVGCGSDLVPLPQCLSRSRRSPATRACCVVRAAARTCART